MEKKSIIVEVHNYFNKKRIEYDNRIFKRKMFQIIWPRSRQKGNDDVCLLWSYGKGYWVLRQGGNSESPWDNQMTSYTNIVSIKLLKGKKEREKMNKIYWYWYILINVVVFYLSQINCIKFFWESWLITGKKVSIKLRWKVSFLVSDQCDLMLCLNHYAARGIWILPNLIKILEFY